MEIEEKGVKLRLTIVDTPGFNDSVDARHWYAQHEMLLLLLMMMMMMMMVMQTTRVELMLL